MPRFEGFMDRLQFEVVPAGSTVVVLTSRLRYTDRRGRQFTVPEGFECDLASVPQWLRSIATPWHQSARAGVLHDCGYRWFEVWGMPRDAMDDLYHQALRVEGVSRFRAWAQWVAVWLRGGDSWDRWRLTSKDEKGVSPPQWISRA